MPTYMKDILDLPDRVMRGDFVLKLSEGVDKPDQTIKDYVVMPQLAESLKAWVSGVTPPPAMGSRIRSCCFEK